MEDDGTGARRFITANPKLTKILEKKEKKKAKKQDMANTLDIGFGLGKDKTEDEKAAKGESYLALAF